MRISLSAGDDLRGFKQYPSATITPELPPFANDLGANKFNPNMMAYLAMKFNGGEDGFKKVVGR